MDAEALYRSHAPFVAGFVARLGVAAADVQDIVQEVFLVAHRRGGYIAGAARPTTWLAEIAVRVVSTARRTRRRRPELPDDAEVLRAAAASSTPADAAETAETLAVVQRALEAVELDRRAIFVLFELEGESCDQIAAGLGLPISTVYSRLHTARQEFTKAFNRLTNTSRGTRIGPTNGVRT